MPSRKPAWLFTLFLLLLVGCGSSSSSQNTSASSSISGTWLFTLTPSSGPSFTSSGLLFDDGQGDLSGSLSLNLPACNAADIYFFGSDEPPAGILLQFVDGSQEVQLFGELSSDRASASGPFSVQGAGCVPQVNGTFTGQLQLPLGNFTGNISAAGRNPIGLSLSLDGPGPQLQGAASFSNSICLRSVAVSGIQSGLEFDLQGSDANGNGVALHGKFDPELRTIEVASQISGHCGGESGTGLLSRISPPHR
jgi:hypothetical protein